MESECIICHNDKSTLDTVNLTCIAQHEICFQCLLKEIEVCNQLKVCPLCRGGVKFVILGKVGSRDPNNFYGIQHFKKMMPFLTKISKSDPNTCLVSEELLLTYVENKKPLEIANKLLESGMSVDDIFNSVRWNAKKMTAENIFDVLENGLVGFLQQSGFSGAEGTTYTYTYPMYPQYPTNTRRRNNNRNRDARNQAGPQNTNANANGLQGS